jgi:hypothetical protein
VKSFIFLVGLLFSIPQAAASSEFIICYDFGCKSMLGIDFNAAQWQAIRQIFNPSAKSPFQEKLQIRHAIALMEQFSGKMVGTGQDQGGNYTGVDLPFQQDCIDESTNTYQYLRALQSRKLLRWHQLDLKQRRIRWFFTHWTATIRQLDSGEVFAVDSWYRDNGEPPYIQKLDDWRRKVAFPDSLNPD